jgi:hypothetical protein
VRRWSRVVTARPHRHPHGGGPTAMRNVPLCVRPQRRVNRASHRSQANSVLPTGTHCMCRHVLHRTFVPRTTVSDSLITANSTPTDPRSLPIGKTTTDWQTRSATLGSGLYLGYVGDLLRTLHDGHASADDGARLPSSASVSLERSTSCWPRASTHCSTSIERVPTHSGRTGMPGVDAHRRQDGIGKRRRLTTE